MKKWLLILVALCLCCSIAAAETSVSVKTVEARSIEMNKEANSFVIQNSETRMYQVVDADLRPLSDEYPRIDNEGSFYEIFADDSSKGLLDAQGQLVFAPMYDDVEVISSRWTVGIKLVESTSDNYDYETLFSSEKKFYLIDTVDVYYMGEKKGTLTRAEWSRASAFGDYLIIQDRDKNCSAWNKDFVKSPVVPEYTSNEYNDDYRSGTVTHVGSGQQAFVPGCTLTADEVQQSTWINKAKQLVDLQGNVLADLSGYYSANVDKESGMIRIRNEENKNGVLDAQGNVLAACVYDSIDYNLAVSLKSGYLYAVKDGKSGFVNLKNGSETGFEFLESAGRQKSVFIVVEDPREGTILVSAAAGELPGRYKEANIPYSSSALFATVTELDGTVHVIDVWGNDVLSDNPAIKNGYDVEISNDGSLILVRDTDRVYHIYTVSVSEDAAAPAEQPADENGEPSEEGQPAEAEDGTWTCENGHSGNTGKFCSECGAAKPAEAGDGTWTCENGHEGNTGNFCSECGAAKPQ